MPSPSLSLIIVSPDKVILESEAVKILIPGAIQDLAILPNHTPLYTLIKQGTIIVEAQDGTKQSIDVESGIMRVRSNRVSIVLGF